MIQVVLLSTAQITCIVLYAKLNRTSTVFFDVLNLSNIKLDHLTRYVLGIMTTSLRLLFDVASRGTAPRQRFYGRHPRTLKSLTMFVLALASTVTSRVEAQFVGDNCQSADADGVLQYYICDSGPVYLLQENASFFTMTVSPSNATCGSTKQIFCTNVSIIVISLLANTITSHICSVHPL